MISLPTDQRRFLLAAAAGTLIVSVIQIIGIALKLPTVALTMGLRSFSNFALFAWPFAFTFLFSCEVLGRFYTGFALVLTGLVWFDMQGGIPILQLLLFAFAISWPERLWPQRRRLYFAVLAIVPLGLVMMGHGDKIFLRWQHDVSAGFYLLALLAAFVIADLLTADRAVGILRKLVTAGLLVLALLRAQAVGAATTEPAVRDLYDTEIWARDHTPPGTSFMTAYGWRTVSQRPAVGLVPDLSEEIYTPFRSIRARNDFLFNLYGISGKWRNMGILDIIIASSAGYQRLNSHDFLALAGKFGAPFLVRAKNEPALDFPLAYQNEHFRIYRIAPTKRGA